jgi:hypothetical protein
LVIAAICLKAALATFTLHICSHQKHLKQSVIVELIGLNHVFTEDRRRSAPLDGAFACSMFETDRCVRFFDMHFWRPSMFTASSGIFLIDTLLKPFAKIFEKNPILALVTVVVMYSIVAYMVFKSAWQSEHC